MGSSVSSSDWCASKSLEANTMNTYLLTVSSVICLVSYLLTPAEAFGSLILTLAGTSYVLTSAQTTLAIASLAGLAVAKEALVLAELSRTRGKRAVDEDAAPQAGKISSAQFNEFFDVIAKSDVADCGKLLVCELMSKEELDQDEKRIANLFDDLEHIDPSSGRSEYQLAAYLGSLNHTEAICVRRYSKCPMSSDEVMDIVRFQRHYSAAF